MKFRTALLFLSIVFAIAAKCYLQLAYTAYKTEHPNLTEVQAGYEGSSLQRYSFGFQNLLSAFLWVQVLQKASHTPLKGSEVSWEYSQVDAITTLDPKFERAYFYGAIFLSSLRRDKLGGKLLLQKWVKHDPLYWRSHYMLGFHYLEELADYQAAAPEILRASSLPGAPVWLSSLGIGILSIEGSLINTIQAAVDLTKTTTNPAVLEPLAKRIRSLNYHYQKNQWETALQNYHSKFQKEPQGMESLRPFYPSAQRNLSSIITTGQDEVSESIQKILEERFAFRYDRQGKVISSMDPELETKMGKLGIYHDQNAAKGTKR